MPIYEYRCEECGHALEAMQKISDPALTDCPACGRAALKKQISAAGFRLKGSGWYETDFKKGNKKNLHDGGDKPSGDSSGSTTSKTGGSDKGGGSTPAKSAA